MIPVSGPILRVALAVAVAAPLLPLRAGAQSAISAGAAAADTLSSPATTERAEAAVAGVEAGPEGFGLRSADGSFRLRLQGLAQYDGRAFVDEAEGGSASGPVSGFELRRARADVRGTLYSEYDFRLHLDFAGNRAEVLDAYLEGRFSPALQLRAGKFKPPVGLERLQSASAVTFPERGFPTALVPNRDVGLQLQGTLGGSLLSYAVGVFNGVPDGGSGDSDPSDSKDLAGRLFLQPFASGPELLRGLGVGIAGTIGDQSGSPANPGLASFRTTIGRGTFLRFRGDDTAEGSARLDGRRTRITPQGSWRWGPAGLLGEYVRSTSEIRIGDDTESQTTSAWQVAGSWVLTGEAASPRGVVPSRPFEPGTGGRGAIELAGRVHGIDADRSAFPTFADPAGAAAGATALTLGLNWYLNRLVRLQAAWEHTRLEAADPSESLADEDVLITRFQVAF